MKNDYKGNVGTLPQADNCKLDLNQLESVFKEWVNLYGPECLHHEVVEDPKTGKLVVQFAIAYSGKTRERNSQAFSNWLETNVADLRQHFEGWEVRRLRPKFAKPIVQSDCQNFNYQSAKKKLE